MKSLETKSVASLVPEKSHGVLRQFLTFMGRNKWWWITPVFLLLALLAIALVVLSRSSVAPFIYSHY